MEKVFIDILEDHVAGLGENEDLLSTIGELNEKLKEKDWKNRAEDLVTDAFYAVLKGELEMKNVVEFLKVIPTGLKTRQMSDDDIMRLIPESEWGYFRPNHWIKKNSKVVPDETRSIR